MHIHFSDSAYQARVILGAWHTGSTEQLRAELDRVTSGGHNTPDSGEAERLELLSQIARELQTSTQPIGAEASSVHRNLLEHLAFSGMRGRRRAATPPSEYARAAAAALLQ